MRMIQSAGMLLMTLLLISCVEEGDTRLQDNIAASTAAFPLFDPAASVIPFPNDLLIHAQSGKLNIPIEDTSNAADPTFGLNTLDGFSTIAPFTVTFSEPVDRTTLQAGVTVRVFEITKSLTGSGQNKELVGGTDFRVDLSPTDINDTTLYISPLRPLRTRARYMVVITNGLRDVAENNMIASSIYAITKGSTVLTGDLAALEPLRQTTNLLENIAESFPSGPVREEVILSWTFRTQSLYEVLTEVYDLNEAATAPASTNWSDSGEDTAFFGYADLFTATLNLPYYHTAADNPSSTIPLTSVWQNSDGAPPDVANPTPIATESRTLPLVASIPNGTDPNAASKPSGGWPVVVFIHPITGDRSNIEALGDSLVLAENAVGAPTPFAAVAIDLPLHGIVDTTDALYDAANERHFNLDLVNNDTGAAGADGAIDPSGEHFINLSSLVTTRDNLRQAVSDVLGLIRALEAMDYDGGGPDFNTSEIHIVGHSLGAMVANVVAALTTNTDVKTVVMGMPGGGIAKFLDGSATFGPEIEAGLAAAGLVKGTTEYEEFVHAAQAIVDSVDPINYAFTNAINGGASANHPLLLLEVIGSATSLPDQTIPNQVGNKPPAGTPAGTVPGYLAGTDPLALLLKLTKVGESIVSPTAGLDLWVRFLAGNHASFLSPLDEQGNVDNALVAVTTEMQTEAVSFVATNGRALLINDPDLVEDVVTTP